MFLKELAALIVAFPEIMKLLKNIQKNLDEQATQKKVKEDLAVINKAFEEKDAKALHDLFNS